VGLGEGWRGRGAKPPLLLQPSVRERTDTTATAGSLRGLSNNGTFQPSPVFMCSGPKLVCGPSYGPTALAKHSQSQRTAFVGFCLPPRACNANKQCSIARALTAAGHSAGDTKRFGQLASESRAERLMRLGMQEASTGQPLGKLAMSGNPAHEGNYSSVGR